MGKVFKKHRPGLFGKTSIGKKVFGKIEGDDKDDGGGSQLDEETKMEAEAERKRRLRQRGKGSTMLTKPGLGQANTGSKALLGE